MNFFDDDIGAPIDNESDEKMAETASEHQLTDEEKAKKLAEAEEQGWQSGIEAAK